MDSAIRLVRAASGNDLEKAVRIVTQLDRKFLVLAGGSWAFSQKLGSPQEIAKLLGKYADRVGPKIAREFVYSLSPWHQIEGISRADGDAGRKIKDSARRYLLSGAKGVDLQDMNYFRTLLFTGDSFDSAMDILNRYQIDWKVDLNPLMHQIRYKIQATEVKNLSDHNIYALIALGLNEINQRTFTLLYGELRRRAAAGGIPILKKIEKIDPEHKSYLSFIKALGIFHQFDAAFAEMPEAVITLAEVSFQDLKSQGEEGENEEDKFVTVFQIYHKLFEPWKGRELVRTREDSATDTVLPILRKAIPKTVSRAKTLGLIVDGMVHTAQKTENEDVWNGIRILLAIHLHRGNIPPDRAQTVRLLIGDLDPETVDRQIREVDEFPDSIAAGSALFLFAPDHRAFYEQTVRMYTRPPGQAPGGYRITHRNGNVTQLVRVGRKTQKVTLLYLDLSFLTPDRKHMKKDLPELMRQYKANSAFFRGHSYWEDVGRVFSGSAGSEAKGPVLFGLGSCRSENEISRDFFRQYPRHYFITNFDTGVGTINDMVYYLYLEQIHSGQRNPLQIMRNIVSRVPDATKEISFPGEKVYEVIKIRDKAMKLRGSRELRRLQEFLPTYAMQMPDQVIPFDKAGQMNQVQLTENQPYRVMKARDNPIYYFRFRNQELFGLSIGRLSALFTPKDNIVALDHENALVRTSKTIRGTNIPSDILANFFSRAKSQGIQLNVLEKRFLEELLKGGILVPQGDGYLAKDKNLCVIASSQETDEDTLNHELSHAIYHMDKKYRESATALWRRIPVAQKTLFKKYLELIFPYDTNNEDLVVNEFQARFRNPGEINDMINYLNSISETVTHSRPESVFYSLRTYYDPKTRQLKSAVTQSLKSLGDQAKLLELQSPLYRKISNISSAATEPAIHSVGGAMGWVWERILRLSAWAHDRWKWVPLLDEHNYSFEKYSFTTAWWLENILSFAVSILTAGLAAYFFIQPGDILYALWLSYEAAWILFYVGHIPHFSPHDLPQNPRSVRVIAILNFLMGFAFFLHPAMLLIAGGLSFVVHRVLNRQILHWLIPLQVLFLDKQAEKIEKIFEQFLPQFADAGTRLRIRSFMTASLLNIKDPATRNQRIEELRDPGIINALAAPVGVLASNADVRKLRDFLYLVIGNPKDRDLILTLTPLIRALADLPGAFSIRAATTRALKGGSPRRGIESLAQLIEVMEGLKYEPLKVQQSIDHLIRFYRGADTIQSLASFALELSQGNVPIRDSQEMVWWLATRDIDGEFVRLLSHLILAPGKSGPLDPSLFRAFEMIFGLADLSPQERVLHLLANRNKIYWALEILKVLRVLKSPHNPIGEYFSLDEFYNVLAADQYRRASVHHGTEDFSIRERFSDYFADPRFVRIRGLLIAANYTTLKGRMSKGQVQTAEQIQTSTVLAALLLNHQRQIIDQTTKIVNEYRGTRGILKGLTPLNGQDFNSFFTRQSVEDVLAHLGIQITGDELENMLKENGFRIFYHQGAPLIIPIVFNNLLSAYRGSSAYDHVEANYLSHSLPVAIIFALRTGGTKSIEAHKNPSGVDAFHEFDLGLLEMAGRRGRKIDPTLPLAFNYRGTPLPEYARKRTILLDQSTVSGQVQNLLRWQLNERMAKQTIHTILTRIGRGELNGEDLIAGMGAIREQLQTLKTDCGLKREYFEAVFGFLDKVFFHFLEKRYPLQKNKTLLLENLLKQALKNFSVVTTAQRNGTPEVRVPHPWLKSRKTLLDYFSYEAETRRGTFDETDVSTKDEISPSQPGAAGFLKKWKWVEKSRISAQSLARKIWKNFRLRELPWVGILESLGIGAVSLLAWLGFMPQAPPSFTVGFISQILALSAPIVLVSYVAMFLIHLLTGVIRFDGRVQIWERLGAGDPENVPLSFKQAFLTSFHATNTAILPTLVLFPFFWAAVFVSAQPWSALLYGTGILASLVLHSKLNGRVAKKQIMKKLKERSHSETPPQNDVGLVFSSQDTSKVAEKVVSLLGERPSKKGMDQFESILNQGSVLIHADAFQNGLQAETKKQNLKLSVT
ncbi:MAG: hypothetical protein HYS58_03085, partial [Elusimicrobia bacterium]|nr:hypothetical protein [Elusimicrobiota bacterium]